MTSNGFGAMLQISHETIAWSTSGDGNPFPRAIRRPRGDSYGTDMTDDEVQIDALGAHHYAITVREGEDLVQINLHADPATVALIATDQFDERRLVEETLRYLVRRQRADDLPPALDLADVAAGYDTWIDEMRGQMNAGAEGRDDEAGQ